MKICNIKNSIGKLFHTHKPFKYTTFPMFNTFDNDDVFVKITNAQGMLENYAKHNGIHIEISDPRKESVKDIVDLLNEKASKTIKIDIKELLSGKKLSRELLIFAGKEKAVKETRKNVMVELKDAGTQQIVKVRSIHELSFLKYLYGNIEDMVNSLSKM